MMPQDREPWQTDREVYRLRAYVEYLYRVIQIDVAPHLNVATFDEYCADHLTPWGRPKEHAKPEGG